MKKVFIIAAILAACMPHALAAEADLIADGGFEGELLGEGNWKFTEYGGWYTEGVAERTDDAKSGSSAVKMNAGIMYQRVAMEKGVTYELSMYLKAEKECSIDICFNDGAEEWPAINGVSVQTVTVGTDWQEVRLEFQSPLTQDYVLSFGTWDEIDVFADDVSIKESGSYISQLKTGVDADGAISYQAEYRTDGVFIAALYDEGGELLGCIKDSDKGTWEVGEGNNYISNPEFEADRVEVESPAGWQVRDSLDGDASANVKGKREAGNFVWQQGNEADYVSELYQDIDGLPDGTYTLKAWVRTSGGQDVCRLYAQSGENEYSVSLKNMSEDWTETVVSSQIEVKDGKCRIGLYSDAPGGTWVQIDELALVRNVE